jgi:hypothetical protein
MSEMMYEEALREGNRKEGLMKASEYLMKASNYSNYDFDKPLYRRIGNLKDKINRITL